MSQQTIKTADIVDSQVTYAKVQDVSAASKLLGRGAGAGSGVVQEISLDSTLALSGTTLGVVGTGLPFELIVACSDETTPFAAATKVISFMMPRAITLTEVRASLSTAQTSGSLITVDINEGGTTILSTKLTIDNGEYTSTTATTPAVISDSSLADDAQITIDIDQIGDGTATGLKITLIGTRV